MTHPHLRLPDAEDPDLIHSFGPIAEREDRGLNDRSQVVGIEVLDVKKRFPNADPKTIHLEMP